MSFHNMFGLHQPNLMTSRWDEGRFVTTCQICGAAMVKPPGGNWLLSKRR